MLLKESIIKHLKNEITSLKKLKQSLKNAIVSEKMKATTLHMVKAPPKTIKKIKKDLLITKVELKSYKTFLNLIKTHEETKD